MRKLIYGGLFGGAALVVIVYAYRQWRLSLYTGMSVSQIADVQTSELLFLLFGIGLVLLVLLLVIGTLRGNRISLPREEPDYIDVTPMPARRQIQQPRHVNVPRLQVNNTPRPIGAQPPTILSTTFDATDRDGAIQAQHIDVPLELLFKLAKLNGPTRSEWSGRNENYSMARKFFMSHGFIDATTGKWKPEYARDQRLDWLGQFEE
jgi:hypothetical protein